jgi:hypothetical protein
MGKLAQELSERPAGCKAIRLVVSIWDQLDAEDRAAVESWFQPGSPVSSQSVVTVLKKHFDLDMNDSAIRNHRRGACKCKPGDAPWS